MYEAKAVQIVITMCELLFRKMNEKFYVKNPNNYMVDSVTKYGKR